MKKPLLLLAMCTLISAASCGVSQKTKLEVRPTGYLEAMDAIATEVRLIDKYLIGSAYEQAVPGAEAVVLYAGDLGGFDPVRGADLYESYQEYGQQVDDLRRACDRLLFMLQQRRKGEAKDMLIEVATRFNRISVNYGPSYEISVLEREPEEFRLSEDYRGDVPGELRHTR